MDGEKVELSFRSRASVLSLVSPSLAAPQRQDGRGQGGDPPSSLSLCTHAFRSLDALPASSRTSAVRYSVRGVKRKGEVGGAGEKRRRGLCVFVWERESAWCAPKQRATPRLQAVHARRHPSPRRGAGATGAGRRWARKTRTKKKRCYPAPNGAWERERAFTPPPTRPRRPFTTPRVLPRMAAV